MTPSTRVAVTSRTVRCLGVLIVAATSLTACAGAPAAVPKKPSTSAAQPSRSATSAPDTRVVDTVTGYDVGQFPPVPLFVLPDLSLLGASAPAFAIEINDALADIPGVTATAARCDGTGGVVTDDSVLNLYGDGSGNYTGPDGTVNNYGDGSGNSVINGIVINNYGDGAGSYTDGTVTINNYGDGSGNYVDATKVINIYGDGSGNFTDGEKVINNYGDGSGSYTDGTVTINNYGDGSGTYTDSDVVISNYGDGTATVGGETVKAEPIAPVPPLGVFPPLGALAPLESCGTTLTFDDGVLFDFDKTDIRADAATTLDTVADVLGSLEIAEASVSGHTDSIGSDSDNQELSEGRAQSVLDALRERGIATSFTAEGFGESRPVAPNEIDGADNPAGRQLNRRVEIFIPAAL